MTDSGVAAVECVIALFVFWAFVGVVQLIADWIRRVIG
jgi:hypothetical protein